MIIFLKMAPIVVIKFVLIIENIAVSEGSIIVCGSPELLLVVNMRKSALYFTLFVLVCEF
jgi:hypothetical protein